MHIDKVYVLHYELLRDRKRYLDGIVPKIHKNYEFIISNSDTDSQIEKNISNWYSHNSKVLERKLKISEICASSSHIHVYRDMIEKGHDLCLVLEDDAIITEEFYNQIDLIVQNADSYDFIFLSTCCGLRSDTHKKNIIYPSEYSRCMTGYLVNRKNLEKIINHLLPFNTNIDNQLNILKKDLDLKYGWFEPPIIIQGSETVYKSNLR